MRKIDRAKKEPGRIMLFESYPEFVKAALGPSDMQGGRHSRFNTDSWSGGSWDHAEKTAPTGDIEGAARLRTGILREANKIMGDMERLDPVYREEGGIWIDVSRFISGEPECWGDMVARGETRKARRAAIVFNAVGNSNVKAEDYERVATLIGGSVLGLRSMGISVSLHVCYANSGGGEVDIATIDMTSGGGFDVARLSAITRTWFFRRIVFSYWETRDKGFRKTHDIRYSYGRSVPMETGDAQLVSGVKEPLILNMEAMTNWNDQQVRDAILGVLTRKEVVT